MKSQKTYFLAFSLLLSINLLSQDRVRYIDPIEPIIETAAPSRDRSDIYHFYFSVNWSNDSSVYSSQLDPKIEELELYEFGANSPFKTIDALVDSKNQVEFKVPKSDVDRYSQIQYSIKWEINNGSGQTLSNRTERRTLRIKFDTDPELLVTISDDRIYYVDDINKPRIKIKTNKDGTAIEELSLRLQQRPDASIIAQVNDDVTRINSNRFTELEFTLGDLGSLREGVSYYLYGKLRNSGLSAPIPLPSENNAYRIVRKERYYIKPHHTLGTVFTVQGNSGIEVTLDATGDVTNVKGSLKLGSYGNRDYSLMSAGNQRWNLKIPGEDLIPFGTYNLEFTGMGNNGQPMKPTTFSYVKEPVKREIIQMEFEENVYKAIAEFSVPPVGKVYLVIDDLDVEMTRSDQDSKVYVVNFAFDDNTLKRVSNLIKNEPNNQKRIKITTKVNGVTNESYLAKNATVIDVEDLEGKNRREISEYLKEIGFQENMEELARNISAELRKDKPERNWGANVWASAVEWAPKAIPLVLMLF